MRARSTLLMVLAAAFTLAGVLGPVPAHGTAVVGAHQSPSLATANVTFPAANMSRIQDVDNLTSFLVPALGLPPVNLTLRNPDDTYMCCLYDMNGHSIAMKNVSSVVVGTRNDTGMNIFYSSTGRLAELELIGAFGTPLSARIWSSMVARAENLGNRLGLSAFPLSFIGSNSTGPNPGGPLGSTRRQTTVAIYSDGYSLPLAFGNQLIITFDADRGIAVGLTLFPWFTAPPPTVSDAQATATALSYLNRTVVANSSLLSNGSWVSSYAAYLGFDSFRYALVYHVDATYTAESHNPPGYPPTVSYDYRVWVDAYSGTIAYWVWVFHLNGPPPSNLSWPSWVLAVLIVAVVLVVVTLTLQRRRQTIPPTMPPPVRPPMGPQT